MFDSSGLQETEETEVSRQTCRLNAAENGGTRVNRAMQVTKVSTQSHC